MGGGVRSVSQWGRGQGSQPMGGGSGQSANRGGGGVRSVSRPGGGGQPRYDNRMSTHYTAGGMPLAFTQEDFLVKNQFPCLNKLHYGQKCYLSLLLWFIEIRLCKSTRCCNIIMSSRIS